jgi:hypothetical protein
LSGVIAMGNDSLKNSSIINFSLFIIYSNGGLESGKLLCSLLETEIFHHPVFVEKDDEAILFLLDSRVLENNEVGKIRLLDGKCGRVLAEIGIDKDVSVVLFLNSVGRPEDRKNFAFGRRANFDSFVGVMLDLRPHIDPSDAATIY